ncbi:MAG TPA: hypothetical protein VI997_06295 [Candidatus Thermoplasmatota archaeon]|nr:hypothetical protein [Candidatus Thermoplasmatota archaeon]
MTETADFPARDAAKVLAEATTYEDALRQRTEGITTAIWGLVSPGIFLSYALMGAAMGDDTSPWMFLFGFLWVPWVAAGVAVTSVMWRTARLAAPNLGREQPKAWVMAVSFLGAYAVFGGLAYVLVPHMNEPTYAFLATGAAWTFFGGINIFRCSARGRVVDTLVGAIIFLAGIAVAFTLPQEVVPGYVYATVTACLVTGLVPLGGGLWQATRG